MDNTSIVSTPLGVCTATSSPTRACARMSAVATGDVRLTFSCTHVGLIRPHDGHRSLDARSLDIFHCRTKKYAIPNELLRWVDLIGALKPLR